MKIQTKLFVFAILCSVFPLLGAFALSFDAAKSSLSKTAEANLLAQAKEELAILQGSLASAKHELVTLSKLTNMQNVRSGDYSGSLQRDLDIFAKRTPLFAEIIAADATGLAVAGTLQNFVNNNLGGTWEFEAPRLGINFDGPVVMSYRLNRPIATQSVPLYSLDNPDVIIGALIGSIDWRHLQKNLSQHTLYGGKQSKRRRIFLESVPDNSILYATAGVSVPHDLLATVVDSTSISRVSLEGRDYLMVSVSSVPLDEFRDPQWRLHLMLDTNIVYTSVIGLQRYFMLAGAGVIILVLGLGFVFSRNIVTPVKALVKGAEQLAAGNYSYTLKTADSKDEIGQLAQSFDAMRVAIRQNEQELINKTEMAEQAARLKGEFLANMSHEVRTPINGVLGMTELLLNTALDNTQTRYAQTISRSGQSLLGVINDILDFSKIEAGKLELAEGPFDLRDLAEDVVELLAEGAQRKGVEMTLYLAPDQHLAYTGDASRLRQVLVNLVGNAVKFTSEGEIQIHVSTTETGSNNAEIRFTVIDTGIGIPPDSQKSIFESFVQADGTTTREFGGSGLGLAISARLTALMGGEIGVDSKPGEGSTFWFTAKVVQLPAAVESVWRNPDALVGRNILIVDDNQTNREILETQVDYWGASPFLACNGAEALHEIEVATKSGRAFDAAILDLHMPGMSGMELAVLVHERKLAPTTRLILLSSACDQLDLQTCKSIGINSMITKPVRQPDLYNCLTAALNCDSSPEHRNRQVPLKIHGANLKGEVLLAEDNPVNQEMMMEMLKLLGIKAVLAENGQEALQAIEQRQFNVVLMDCQMPVMDGFEATHHIRESESKNPENGHLPIIALTANALEGDRERCLDSGMDEYLSKPVSSQQLRTMLENWLDTASAVESESESATSGYSGDPPARSHSEENVTSDANDASDEQEPIIDESVFSEVWAMSLQASPGFYGNLIATYEKGSHEDLQMLTKGIASHQPEIVAAHAHRLKSSSANWGGRRVARLCQLLETAAKANDLDDSTEQLRHLVHEHAVLLNALRSRETRAA
ncbi:MAG: response regulator [Gammaproteobacteria bacterium]|nr:response regulator [Gammaproteobacteria bacterium]